MRAAAPRDAVRALVLALSFVARAVVDDPVWLGIQAARRAPAPVRSGVVRLLLVARDPSARRALGLFLDGSPDDAARTVAAVLRAPGERRSRPGRRPPPWRPGRAQRPAGGSSTVYSTSSPR
ncbi:hypothetical protein IU11_02315 [Cellulosimicrobium sp. MM]|nr:hypothetical protein [Cellulosimicrobium sp. MM]KFD44463.1 hypothetical protein IU11_02315 [Cellulosimicrobium sp. MM]